MMSSLNPQVVHYVDYRHNFIEEWEIDSKFYPCFHIELLQEHVLACQSQPFQPLLVDLGLFTGVLR
jgi:hypothetical protein